MVIDMRTRLPHGHLVNRSADMRFHAQQLTQAAEQLRAVLQDIQALRLATVELNTAAH